MAALEEKVLGKVKKKLGCMLTRLLGGNLEVSWRYIDDIFFIRKHGKE